MLYEKEIKTNLGKANSEKANSGKASLGKASSEKANPKKASSGKASLGKANAGKASSRKARPEKANPKKASSGKANPEKANSGKASLGKASSEKANPKKASSEKASLGKASSEKANAGKANPKKANSGKANPKKVSPKKTSLGKASSRKARPEKTNPEKANPKKVNSGKTRSRKANSKGKKIKINLTQDMVFKHFFATSEDILKKVLERFIPKLGAISGVKVINPELGPEGSKKGGKTFLLDLLVELKTGEKVNIEMQNVQDADFFTRVIGYAARLFIQGFKKGKDYKEVKATYSLVFLSKSAKELKGVSDHISHFAFVRTKAPHVILSNKLNITVVELSKLSEEDIEKLDIVEKWCYFIKKSGQLSSKDIKNLSKEKELKMAIKHLESLSQDEKFIYELRVEKALENHKALLRHTKNQGINQGIKKGRKEGREEEKKALIVNLLKKKQPISFISEVTDWPEEKVLETIKYIKFKE